MTLDPKGLEAAARASCASDGIDPDIGSIICMSPVATMLAWKIRLPRVHAAITAYLEAAGLVEVPVIKGSGE